MRRPAACDLSRGIVVDNAAATITFHLTAPDAAFLDKLALRAAIAVPHSDAGPVPPATGPYAIARLQSKRFVRLVRNPHFHVWSGAAKPDGYVDEITIQLGVNQRAGLRAVERGQADYMFGAVPSEQNTIEELRTRYAGQVHTNPQPVLISAFLNTRVAPFDNVDARRALNFAVDRRAAADVAGASSQPTCQVLPPDFPGYRPYCPYTLSPGAGRPWSAPDLVTARRLIARSHTRGMRVTVRAPKPEFAAYARFLVTLLGKLGYRASSRLMPIEKYFPYINDSRHQAQIGVTYWGPDYPSASQFLRLLFSCRSFTRNDPANANKSEFCDQRADRLIERALQATDPASANALWARADRRVVDKAAVLPLENPEQIDVVSRRAGNYQYSPQLQILLDQLWVR
jgi:peptide/nickel transport system substrate-binding protein